MIKEANKIFCFFGGIRSKEVKVVWVEKQKQKQNLFQLPTLEDTN